METVSLRVANFEENELEKVDYSVSIKVPRKQELLNLLPHHLEKLQYNIKFVTGILSTVGHAITLDIFREYNEARLGVFVTIGHHPEKNVRVNMIDANYVALDQANIEYSLSRSKPAKDFEIPAEHIGFLGTDGQEAQDTEFWISTGGWHDETAMIFLTFHVIARYPPKLVSEEEDTFKHRLLATDNGRIDVCNLYLNDQFSDITIKCQEAEFPAHRLVLSASVKYFETMLSTKMKESLEGKIKLDDMSPSVCKELLRFIYQGKVDNLSHCVTQLYIAADKYGMNDLRGLCEWHLYNNLSYENAMQVYNLGHMHGTPILAERAKEVIKSNRDKFAPNAEVLKAFTCKYPDLVFDLLKMPSK